MKILLSACLLLLCGMYSPLEIICCNSSGCYDCATDTHKSIVKSEAEVEAELIEWRLERARVEYDRALEEEMHTDPGPKGMEEEEK